MEVCALLERGKELQCHFNHFDRSGNPEGASFEACKPVSLLTVVTLDAVGVSLGLCEVRSVSNVSETSE